MYKLFIFIAISIFLITAYLIYLVKTRKLKIEYSILWILSLIIILAFSFWVRLLNIIANFLGVAYPPSLIIIAVIILGIFILLNLTQILSKLSNDKKNIMQEFVIYKAREYQKKSNILIILPAYNEEKNIKRVVSDIRKKYNHDILVINDGSSDRTVDVLEELNCPHLNLPINSGYGVALETGYKFASKFKYEYLVQFDADGQHDVDSIGKLMSKIQEENLDVVIGSRFLNSKDYKAPFARRTGMLLFQFIIKLITRKKMTDPTSGLHILKKDVFEFFSKQNRFPTQYPDADIIILLHKNRFKFEEINVRMYPSKKATSMHQGFIKPFIYLIQMFLSIFIVLISGKNRK